MVDGSTNVVESAIISYTIERTDQALRQLYLEIMQNDLLVPISSEISELRSGGLDVPVICLRTNTGDGAIPAFTTLDQLLRWKPEGCKYVTLAGKELVAMALNMNEISRIVVNVEGVPRGSISRLEFARLIDCHLDK